MIQKGSRVIIHKPSKTYESPIWLGEMDEMNGRTYTVREVRKVNHEPKLTLVYVDEPKYKGTEFTFSHSYAFNINWCEEIVESEEEIDIDDSTWESYLEEWKRWEEENS